MQRFLMVLSALAMVALVGCEGAESEVKQHGAWTSLGSVNDGAYSSSVWKRTDPDTGATVYLSTRGSVTVVAAR